MKKGFAIAGVATALTGLLATSASLTAVAAPKKVTLTFWNEDSTGGQHTQIVADVNAFEKAHPGVTIQMTTYSDANLKLKVQTGLVSHTLPDVTEWWGGSYIQPEVQSGAFQDLTPYINSHKSWKNGFLNEAFSNYTVKGKIYGAPFESPVVEMFYNKALFKKAGIAGPPKTWSQMLNDVKKLNAKNIVPIAVGAKDNWPMQEVYQYLVMRDGGTNLIYQALAGKASWAKGGFVKGAEQLMQLVNNKAFEPGFLGKDNTAASNMFQGGQAGMFIIGSWEIGNLSTPYLKKNISFADFPTIPGGKGTQFDAQGGPNGCYSVSNYSSNKELADEFVAFLTSKEQASKWMTAGQQTVPNKVSYNKKSVPAILNKLVAEMPKYKHYNLFWNEIMSNAASTQYYNYMNSMLAGQITPSQFGQNMEQYMKSNPGQ